MISNSSQPLRFGLIGAGGISASWSQAIAALADVVRLVAVADVEGERATRLAAAHAGAQGFSSVRQMVLETELDAVVICSPPCFHHEQTCELVRRGVHVLCEKPLALTVKSARDMQAEAARAGVCFTMASKFRFVPDVIEARRLVQSGAIGDVILFENQFTSLVDMSQRWNSRPDISGGGVLIDNGTHSLDIMRYFLGPVQEVLVVEGRRVQNLPVEDTVHIFARNEAGALGSIDLSWSINKACPWFINLHGSRGAIQVGWKISQVRTGEAKDWTVYGSGYDKNVAFRGQLLNFARAIRGEEQLIVTPEEGVASVAAVRSAYEALERMHWTAVGTAGTGAP
jgi:predicted dehydrogenase